MDTKITKNMQLEYLILITLHDHDEYKEAGLKLENLLARLAENKPLWLEGKRANEWDKRLNRLLSELSKDKVLKKPDGERKFFEGTELSRRLEMRVEELYQSLDIEIHYGECAEDLTDPQAVIQCLKDGSLRYDYNGESSLLEKLILTHEQIRRIAELYVEFELSDELYMRGISSIAQ